MDYIIPPKFQVGMKLKCKPSAYTKHGYIVLRGNAYVSGKEGTVKEIIWNSAHQCFEYYFEEFEGKVFEKYLREVKWSFKNALRFKYEFRFKNAKSKNN